MWGSGRQMSARIEASGEPFGVEQGRIAGTGLRAAGDQASAAGLVSPAAIVLRRITAAIGQQPQVNGGGGHGLWTDPFPTPAGASASAVAWRQERR